MTISATELGNYDVANTNPNVITTGGIIPVGALAIVTSLVSSDTISFSTPTDAKGNTWGVAVHQNTSGDLITIAILFSVITTQLASTDTISVNLSSGIDGGGHFGYFTNDAGGWLAQASVLDKSSSAITAFNTPWSSGATATTTQAVELAVCVAANGGNVGVTSTPPSGWTEQSDLNLTHPGRNFTSAWVALASTQAVTAAGSWSASESGAAAVATFKAATVAAGARGRAPIVSREAHRRSTRW